MLLARLHLVRTFEIVDTQGNELKPFAKYRWREIWVELYNDEE